MRPRLTVLAGLCVMLLALAGPARAEEKLVEPGKIFQFLDAYLGLPPATRDRFHLVYLIVAKTGSLADLRMALVADGRRTPIPIAPDGRITRLPSAGELARGKLALTAPTGAKIGLRMELAASMPPSTDLSADALEATLVQANAGVRKGAGVFALAAPRLERVVFKGAQGGELIAADGRRTVLPLAKGDPYYQPAKGAAARAIRLKRAPAMILLESRD